MQQDAFTTSEFRGPGAPSADEPPQARQPVIIRATNAGEQSEMMGRQDNGEHFMGACPNCGSQREYASMP